jgi:alpha,alpha-trehalase
VTPGALRHRPRAGGGRAVFGAVLAGYLLLFVAAPFAVATSAQGIAPEEEGLAPILRAISERWDELTRSTNRCASVVDPKTKGAPVLYLPEGYPISPRIDRLRAECGVVVKHLPRIIHRAGEIDPATISPPGLLYLENDYVVPGGRFNEMYGWDSYFIVRGLLRDGRVELARGMVENFFFEIENYGAVLNANRTYYLSRSQPPFLSSMVLAIHDAEAKRGRADRAWLARSYGFIARDYALWTSAPHLAGATGLSRYDDFGHGPPEEAAQDEAGLSRKAIAYFLLHPADAEDMLVVGPPPGPPALPPPSATVAVCDLVASDGFPECEPDRIVRLSAEYYEGDRSMRESGFDVSFRFGPFGSRTQHYAPVCLNTLLYQTEKDMERISRELGRLQDAATWAERAKLRRERLVARLWDEKRGAFFDDDVARGRRSTYLFLTTYYPLWAGLATREQARHLVALLPRFESAGGLMTSLETTGAQWDAPFGWAPLHLLAIEGLRRYGFDRDADRVSYEFLSTVLDGFRRDGTIREKYDVVQRSAEAIPDVGYAANVVGFGWTNATFVLLLDELSPPWRARLAQVRTAPAAVPPAIAPSPSPAG